MSGGTVDRARIVLLAAGHAVDDSYQGAVPALLPFFVCARHFRPECLPCGDQVRQVDGGSPGPRYAGTAGQQPRRRHRQLEAGHYLIATGAVPQIPPVNGLEQAGYLTSATAMELTGLPESVLVIGGNAVGLEMAQLFARLGTRVTIAEAAGLLAPFDEPEVSAAIEDTLDDEGIGIVTAAAVMSVRRETRGRSVRIRTAGEADRELAYGQVLVAAGRRAVTAGLNLDAVGVRAGGRGEVRTDSCQRTASPRIWAAGDVTGGPQFVYVAAAQGSCAA